MQPARTIGLSMTMVHRRSRLWRRFPISKNPRVKVNYVAKMPVAAMLKPEVAGSRFKAYSSNPFA